MRQVFTWLLMLLPLLFVMCMKHELLAEVNSHSRQRQKRWRELLREYYNGLIFMTQNGQDSGILCVLARYRERMLSDDKMNEELEKNSMAADRKLSFAHRSVVTEDFTEDPEGVT